MIEQHPNEIEEWLAHQIEQWVETYKKSMLTPLVLRIVATQGVATVADITQEIQRTTQWKLTERGLYRTLQRLEKIGYLQSAETNALRTGRKKKEITLTEIGRIFLKEISAQTVKISE